jgi:hypothetical protein
MPWNVYLETPNDPPPAVGDRTVRRAGSTLIVKCTDEADAHALSALIPGSKVGESITLDCWGPRHDGPQYY